MSSHCSANPCGQRPSNRVRERERERERDRGTEGERERDERERRDCQSDMEGTIEDCRGCGKMDCGRAGWSVDFHFSPFATQRKEIGRIRSSFDGNPGIREWEAQTTCDLGWRLQCVPVWYDRLSIPRPRTMMDTNDSLRADTERELFTRSSWSNPEDSLTQMDFIMISRKLEIKHVQVLESDWFKTDHRAVYAVLSLRPKMRYTVKTVGNLRGWMPDDSWHDAAAATLTDWKSWNKLAPLLVETAKAHRKVESKEMSVELKTLLLRKKKTGRYLERTELNWLCREIWRKRRALKREKHLDKIKESAEMGRAPKKTQSISTGNQLQKTKIQNLFSQNISETSLSSLSLLMRE